MKEFWEQHRKGILGFAAGAFVMLGMVGANLLCGRLPPPFAQVCVGVAQKAVDVVAVEIQRSSDGGTSVAVITNAPAPDAAPAEVCPEANCIWYPGKQGGYALPLADGGRCSCEHTQR